MLPLAYLREQTEKIKEGLAKRNFPQPELVDQLLEKDQKLSLIHISEPTRPY